MSVQEFSKLSDEAIEGLKERIGQPVRRGRPYVSELNADAIRHYAFGIGDTNPMWTDPEYASRSAAGRLLAPPSVLFAMDKILSGYVMGLPGVHAMFAGADLRFERALAVGDRLRGSAELKAVIERPSKFAGRSLQQIYKVDFHDDEGSARGGG